MTPPSRLLAAAKEVLWRLDMAEENDQRNGPVIPGAWVHEELRAAILEAESEPKVERVEVDKRWLYSVDGWKFYAERPIAPPKPKEPTNAELAGLVRDLASEWGGAEMALAKQKLLERAADRLEGK